MTDPAKPECPADMVKLVETFLLRAIGFARGTIPLDMIQSAEKNLKDAIAALAKDGEPSHCDLINVPEKRVFWVNEYAAGFGYPELTREAVDRDADKRRIGRHRIEVISGRFDE